MDKVNLQEKFGLFHEQWTPKVVGELNGQQVRLAKVQGDFVWHKHDEEDEFFLVVKGQLTIDLRDQRVVINEGEFFVVPRGVEHKPSAEDETHLLLFEPAETRHTGDVESARTVHNMEKI